MYPFAFKHMHIWVGLSSCIIPYLAINFANMLLFELDYDTIWATYSQPVLSPL